MRRQRPPCLVAGVNITLAEVVVAISGFVVRESTVSSALHGRLATGHVRVETVFLGRSSSQRQWLKDLLITGLGSVWCRHTQSRCCRWH